MVEETSSKLLWYTMSDKEVRYYNSSAHCKVQRLTKLLTERQAVFQTSHSANKIIIFFNFAKPFRKIVAEINLSI